MKQLRLAKDLTLPLDAVTQTFLIVGKRGSGKSNTAARFVEQLHHARLPFVVLDPVDTWWGLKASRDGGKGLDVYVFGGKHADLPLEAGGGALIADVLCEHRMPMVLSVKHLSGRERSTFMVAFAQTLFQKWGGGPLHVVLEEAHELAPQNTQNAKEGEQAMLGAFKRLWKLGRASGIGGTAVTQRPASLSKDITTQSEILIAHRTIGPQDVKAVGEWVKYHGERLDILAELPTLPTGEAFVWAPEFPEGKAIGLQRSSILLRETYDSASTPKVGEQRVEPKELAAVDLDRLRVKMAATIEKAKADDPRELRKQIAELKKQVGSKVDSPAPVAAKEKRVEILTAADRALLEKLTERFEALTAVRRASEFVTGIEALRRSLDEYTQRLINVLSSEDAKFLTALDSKGFQKILGKLAAVTPPPNTPAPIATGSRTPPAASQGRRVAPAAATSRPASLPPSASGQVKGCAGAILAVLAQYPDGCLKGKLALLAGYPYNGSFRTRLSELRTAGLIVGGNEDVMRITDLGLEAGPFPTLPAPGAERAAYWLAQFSGQAHSILSALLKHENGLTADELAEATGYPWNGSFRTRLSELRTAGVVVGKNTETMRASEELF